MSEKQKKQEETKQKAVPKAVPLEIMLECAEEFTVRGAKYLVRPLFLGETKEFERDGLSVGPQLINLVDKNMRNALDKWIKKVVFDKDGKQLSLGQLENEYWTIKDLRELLLKLVDMSG